MKFYRMLSEDIRYNLATEEYLMDNIDVSEPCLLLYIQKPCVIIGRNQNAYQEIDFEYLRSRNIVLTRRTSGGWEKVFWQCYVYKKRPDVFSWHIDV